MDREVQFARTLSDLVRQARTAGGVISEEEVKSAFKDIDLAEEQLDLVFDYLRKHNIGIGEPAKEEDYLDKEELDYLQMYLDELKALPEYSDGEKEAITISAMAGEADAQSRLIEIFLPDVVEIAKLYAGQGAFIEDLIGEGNVALSMGVTMLGALEHAKEAQGALASMIMNAMEDYIAECSDESKKEEKVAGRVNEVAEKADELSEEFRRKVTVEELMQETGMSGKMIRDAIRLSGFKIDSIEPEAGTEDSGN